MIGFAVIPTVADEASALIDEAPEIIDRAEAELDEVIAWYRANVPQNVRTDIEDGVSDVGGRIGEFILARSADTVDFVTGGLFSIIGYVVIPFFLFYLLKDGQRLRVWFLRLFPPGLQADVAVVLESVQRTFAAYLRAQLTLGVIIAIVTGLGLWAMGVRFPVALALAAGVTELIPFIGPFLGFVPAMVVVLATDPEKWWWLVIFYMAVQQLEGQILVPIVHGHAVTMHPAAIMALVVIGGAVFGLAGTILIVPAAAAVRDTYSYIYRRLNNDLPPPGVSPLELARAPAAAGAHRHRRAGAAARCGADRAGTRDAGRTRRRGRYDARRAEARRCGVRRRGAGAGRTTGRGGGLGLPGRLRDHVTRALTRLVVVAEDRFQPATDVALQPLDGDDDQPYRRAADDRGRPARARRGLRCRPARAGWRRSGRRARRGDPGSQR